MSFFKDTSSSSAVVYDLRGYGLKEISKDIYFYLYLAYQAKVEANPIPKKEEAYVWSQAMTAKEEDFFIKSYLEACLSTGINTELLVDMAEANKAELKEVIQNFYFYNSGYAEVATPSSVLNFIPEINSFNKNDQVADFFSGTGMSTHFLIESGVRHITSVDISNTVCAIQAIKRKLMVKEIDYQIYNQNIFDYSRKFPQQKFDFIFADIPWAVRLPQSLTEVPNDLVESKINPKSSEWFFLSLILSHLKEKGRAVVTLPNRIDFSAIDADVRREFIKKGYIEKVIQLPNNVYHHTSIDSLLIVLSFNNTEVEFINASEMASKKGRFNTFSLKETKNIMRPDYTYRKVVDLAKVSESERLLPSFYTVTQIENYVELKDIAEIVRGKNFSRNELDQLIVDEVTGVELIRTSHINDYGIYDTNNLRNLPDKSIEVYEDDILITRVGSSKSVAIFEKQEGTQSVIDQSLLIVRMQNEDFDAYYVLGFLMSELGKEQLAAAYSSGTISQLSVKNLGKIKIPILNTEEQRKIAAKVRRQVKEIKKLNFQLHFALEELDEASNQFFEGGL